MVLACAEFVALPMPVGCDVPAGALNHTGVMSKRNELLLRSRAATVSLAQQLRDLQEDCVIAGRELESEAAPFPGRFATYLLTPWLQRPAARCNLLTYPRFLSPQWHNKVEKEPNAAMKALERGGIDRKQFAKPRNGIREFQLHQPQSVRDQLINAC